MALSFNHATKRIAVPAVDAQPLQIQALLNAIRTEEASERGICYDQIATAAGKDDLGGGVQVGITLNLRSTWKLEFETGSYQATITGGNLADALARVQNTSSPQVLVQSSAAATVVDGGGGTSLTPAQVWAYVIEAGMPAEQIVRLLLSALTGTTTGAGSATETFRSVDGLTTRISTTFDGNGNRQSVTLNGA